MDVCDDTHDGCVCTYASHMRSDMYTWYVQICSAYPHWFIFCASIFNLFFMSTLIRKRNWMVTDNISRSTSRCVYVYVCVNVCVHHIRGRTWASHTHTHTHTHIHSLPHSLTHTLPLARTHGHMNAHTRTRTPCHIQLEHASAASLSRTVFVSRL